MQRRLTCARSRTPGNGPPNRDIEGDRRVAVRYREERPGYACAAETTQFSPILALPGPPQLKDLRASQTLAQHGRTQLRVPLPRTWTLNTQPAPAVGAGGGGHALGS